MRQSLNWFIIVFLNENVVAKCKTVGSIFLTAIKKLMKILRHKAILLASFLIVDYYFFMPRLQ